jgi:hypothetical protein
MTKAAAHYCVLLWTVFILLFLADLYMIFIVCPKVKTIWLRIVMFFCGASFIVAVPLLNLVLGCGLV